MTNLGAVCNFEYALPLSDSAADRRRAQLYDGIYNRWFIRGACSTAHTPPTVLGGLPRTCLKAGKTTWATIRHTASTGWG